MRKWGVLATLAFSATALAQQSGGATPYSVDLLRSNTEEETIADIEWIEGSVPVYILPTEDGNSIPFARIEARLRHRDWSFFWNNALVRSGESAEEIFAMEVPLQGEYTQVELFGSRNVIQLERELLVLHFPKWRETQLAQNLMKKRDDGAAAGPLGPRVLVAAGPEILTAGAASSTAVTVRLHGHTGLGKSNRLRIGAGAWITSAVLSLSNTLESTRRLELDTFLGYTFGGRTRLSLLGGLSFLSLTGSESLVGFTVSGPFVTPSLQLLLGGGLELAFTPRAAYYANLPDGVDPWLEVGAQLQIKFGGRDRGALSVIAELRLLDTGAASNLTTVFGGLGYSL